MKKKYYRPQTKGKKTGKGFDSRNSSIGRFNGLWKFKN